MNSPAIALRAWDGHSWVNQGILPASYTCERSFASGERGGGGGSGREGKGGGWGGGGSRGELSPSKGATNSALQLAATTCPAVGNPIIVSTGNKVEPESDFGTAGEMPLHLARTWNHYYWDAVTLFGFNWLSNFDYRLSFGSSAPFFGPTNSCYARPSIAECTTAALNTQAWAHRPDGRMIELVRAADGVYYENKASPITRMVRQADGTWLLTFEDNLTELYSKGGYPLWIQDEHGLRWTFTYGGGGGTQLQRVTHSSGRFVQFVWVGTELREIRDPAGASYKFTYTAQGEDDGLHVLKSATTPGVPEVTTTYHYAGEPGEPTYAFSALTGKSVNGVRYSRFEYDSDMRATSTEHAGGVERYSFAYTAGPGDTLSVVETNPLSKQTTYAFSGDKLTSLTGHASANCPLTGNSNTYDANGYLDVATDFNGNKVDYDYNAAGQLQSIVEAVGKAEARTTTYTWDTTRNRITGFTLADAAGPVARTDYTFTSDNRIGSVVQTNLSSKVPVSAGDARVTTYAYTRHPNGVLATMMVDGPLADDAVTSTYNTFGDLLEIRNGLDHKTTYSGHNALGMPGRVIGANGDITDFAYDARGRVTDVKPIVGGVAQTTHYTYDGMGRLASIQTPDGRNHVREYDAAWRLTREYEQEPAGTYAVKRYTYNNASLVTSVTTERTTAVKPPASAPVLAVPAFGYNGAYTVSWSAPAATEFYRIEEQVGSGAWVTIYEGGALNKSFSGKAAGPYSYRAQACNAAGCTGPAEVRTVQVLYPPAPPSAPNAPSPNITGAYAVSWPAVSGADSYELQESVNGGASWAVIHVGGNSKALTDKTAGSYTYRARSCNAAGCGGMSGTGTVQVVIPTTPGMPSAPSQSTSGSYTVSWSAVAYASSYQLEESVNGGAWTLVHNAAATSKIVTGKTAGTYYYRVKACNGVGCSAPTGSVSVLEIDPPTSAPALSAPAVNEYGSFTVTWSGVSGADSYQLEEYIPGGNWTLIYNGGAGSWSVSRAMTQTHYYHVRACNAAGCGPTSGDIVVQQPVYGAQFVGQSIPSGNIYPGDSWLVTVQMRNTGNTTWTAAAAYNLGSQTSTDNTRWGLSRVAVPGSVAPGQVATFSFYIIGPSGVPEGLKVFQWRMVRDGVTWFGDQTPLTYIPLEVPDGGGDPDPCQGRPNCHEN